MSAKATCIFPLCSRPAEHDELCFLHKVFSKKDVLKTVPEKIAARSLKRKSDQKEYVKIVKAMLAENPFCEIKAEGCQGKATGLHHMKKRSPATFLDKRFLKRACDSCQRFCEKNPVVALLKGYSVSKFAPVK